jgi:hypothetical protein
VSWSFYNPATGEIHTRTFSGSTKLLALNTPPGTVAIEGSFNHRTQRVDVRTGNVVDYQPGIDAVRDELLKQQAQDRIDALEAAQLRPIRELLIDPADATAKQRIIEIETEITTLRARL